MSSPSWIILSVSNDQALELQGLFVLGPDANGLLTVRNYDNGATVSATLYDAQNQPVPGCTNIPLGYVPSSTGVYRGSVGPDFAPPVNEPYRLVISALTSGGLRMKATLTAIVQLRQQ